MNKLELFLWKAGITTCTILLVIMCVCVALEMVQCVFRLYGAL